MLRAHFGLPSVESGKLLTINFVLFTSCLLLCAVM